MNFPDPGVGAVLAQLLEMIVEADGRHGHLLRFVDTPDNVVSSSGLLVTNAPFRYPDSSEQTISITRSTVRMLYIGGFITFPLGVRVAGLFALTSRGVKVALSHMA